MPAPSQARATNILEIKNLKTIFSTDEGVVRAVDGVDLTIPRNTTVGIVGESGCGKSVTAMSILRLLPERISRISGEILYHQDNGTVDLASVSLRQDTIRQIRGKEIAMIFQEPMTSLNPVFNVGNQLMESIFLHQKASSKEAKARAISMLEKVGIPEPTRRMKEFPHQLSGGMRQRIMIAMALSCNPALLIADEPTTALDVTIQAQILTLMQNLQQEFQTSIMMITHDLGVIAEMADDVAVMYLGQIVEQSSVGELFRDPQHPYTKGLLESIPKFESIWEKRLEPIQGMVPEANKIPSGCRFSARCHQKGESCNDSAPLFFETKPRHYVRCWRCR